LRVAIGLIKPDEGKVFLEGREIEELDERELLEIRSRLVGIVFQEQALFSSMSVYDNTAYRLMEHDWPEEKIDPAVREILRFVGLDQDTDKLLEELSGGMRRRLEFARAIVGWPRIMLFDEPTAGLDPINERNLLDLVIRARDVQKIAALYVTKELREIPYIASHIAIEAMGESAVVKEAPPENRKPMRVMVLEKGRVVFMGTPDEFGASTSTPVQRLTHPESGIPKSDEFIPDPWDPKRKPKEKLF